MVVVARAVHDHQRRAVAAYVVQHGGVRVDGRDEDPLHPLLDDRSASEWGKEFLICDAAAVTLVHFREGLEFDPRAARKVRELKIRAIKAALKTGKQP